ncbi:MAG: acyl-CoA thioesterase [Opitutaceae bacterium]|nr:acyl-CoA thioesterase [Opitutaceae bacterium]
MSFVYQRTVHFSDTDAAGVVFFANYLAICHEAYEESLAAAGLEVATFFSANGIVVPIAKSTADYLRPLRVGDKLRVSVKPELLSENSFAIAYELFRSGPPEKLAARVRTEHVSTSLQLRQRVPLPPALTGWIQQS